MTTEKRRAASARNWEKAMAVLRLKPKQRVALICKSCSKPYEVEPYRKNKSKYCCWQCGQAGKGHIAAVLRSNSLQSRTNTKSYEKYWGRHKHRVVMESKIKGPIPKGMVVHHIDEDIHNNHPDNLKLVTRREHILIHRDAMAEAQRRANEEKARLSS